MDAIESLAGQLEKADEDDKINPNYVFLKFQVFNAAPTKNAQPTLLGSSLMKANRLIDLDKICSSQ